jgi:hypothetical protein
MSSTMANPTWYSIDQNLTTQEHVQVSLEEALAIVRRYFADVQPSYPSGEEALARTMFGFSRSNNEFVEIGVNGPTEASVKVELPLQGVSWFRRLLGGGVFQHEETVSSQGVEERVRQFFTLSTDDLRTQLNR